MSGPRLQSAPPGVHPSSVKASASAFCAAAESTVAPSVKKASKSEAMLPALRQGGHVCVCVTCVCVLYCEIYVVVDLVCIVCECECESEYGCAYVYEQRVCKCP